MIRRPSIVSAVAGTGSAATIPPMAFQEQSLSQLSGKKCRLKYAPHFGMFENHAGKDPVDQLKFAADVGFTAWEDNGMMGRDTAEQERIGKAMADLGMTMGVFVTDADFGKAAYALGGKQTRDALVAKMKQALEVARRVNAKWTTVVPGAYDQRLEWDYQTANVIDCLKAMAEVAEPAGVVMVLEPLNPYTDHPGLFLTKIPQAYQICRAVGSPSCKILDDLYHQQITEGNLIPNIDKAWDEIAYFQLGDNPGRNEPTTGEINYQNIVKHIHSKGFEGVLGMEHGKSQGGKAGELKLIAAYRWVDAF
jgi:hydroxypyruvate isomerase